MSKKLATAVHLTDDSGVVHSFLPGQTVPKWARKRITNPKAWAADDEATDDTSIDEAGSEDDDQSTDDQSDASEIPSKAASTAAWAEYADKNGFEVEEGTSRKDIIAALEANGIPTSK